MNLFLGQSSTIIAIGMYLNKAQNLCFRWSSTLETSGITIWGRVRIG
jgi:hypothetical protein